MMARNGTAGWPRRRLATVAAATVVALAGTFAATAQEADAWPEPERCPRFVASYEPVVQPASFVVPAQAVGGGSVRVTYVAHATFLIESPAGVTIATDYSDTSRPAVTPEIATMNRAHISHYTLNPDPGIAHVLHGWGEDGAPAAHDLTVRDVWIRNVTTNIRGGFDARRTVRDANSIFVFEVAGLCIAHLGHLHHPLTEDHLDALGRIDVVLAPVDGSFTLNTDDMIRTLRDIQAPVVIPMHFFGMGTLNAFVLSMSEHYAVEVSDGRSVTLSRETLPREPTLLVLGGFL